MSAPFFWIIIPWIISIGLLALLKKPRLTKTIGLVTGFLLTLMAALQTIGDVIKIGPILVNIEPTTIFLGRELTLENSDRFALSLIFFVLTIYIAAYDVKNLPVKFIPLSMMTVGLMVAAIAVQPFLYAAVFVELATLLMIPMVVDSENSRDKGILTFIIFQAMAIPFILFSGWILGGMQANPSDQLQLSIAAFFLLMGFGLWLAVFPFHSWVPQFSNAINPYFGGFIFSLLPVVILLIIVQYVSGLIWLREGSFLSPVLETVGIIMIVSSGIWASAEKQLRRLLGYSVLFETGFALLLISLQSITGTSLLFQSLFPRIMALFLMSYSISLFHGSGVQLSLPGVKGLIKRFPFSSVSLLFSLVSIAGTPLFAGFPAKMGILQNLGETSVGMVIWILFGVGGFIVAFLRIFTSVTEPSESRLKVTETIPQALVLSLSLLVLLIMGWFPQMITNLLQGIILSIPVLK